MCWGRMSGNILSMREDITVRHSEPEDHDAAIALYRKFGFEVEGTHKRFALRGGEYADAHVMARLKQPPNF